jgi:GTPase Era involved in 16S rRNA processing
MSTASRHTLLVIGDGKAGKSALGNAYLEQNILNTDTYALSTWSEREVLGMIRVVIDTPGMRNDSQANGASIQDIVQFLKKY